MPNRGGETEAVQLIQATVEQAAAAGQGAAVTWAHWAAMRLYNGLGRRLGSGRPDNLETRGTLGRSARALANADVAIGALQRLAETTRPGGNDLALGIEARCRALVSDGETAERLYHEAIDRLGRTQLRPDLARAHLLYGEWLRGQGRPRHAREQLRTPRRHPRRLCQRDDDA